MSAAARVPANTNSTRSAHFRTLVGSGSTLVVAAVAAAIVFTIGAAKHSPEVMVGGPLAVALLALAICWFRADDQAEDEFFKRFADAHGMTHSPKWSLYELTPLLGGGDRRKCEHWMENKAEGIGWYTFEVKHENGENKDTYTSYDFTLSMIEIGELSTHRFQGIYLRRKRGVFERLNSDANWLAKGHLEKVELESTAFCDKYELWKEPHQDDIALRQLFSPKFILWLTDHPLEPGFELRAGTLVTFIPSHCGEAGKLEWLLLAGREIATRVQLELTEAAQAGSR